MSDMEEAPKVAPKVKIEPTPTIGAQVTIRIGDVAQIELQSFIERDEPYPDQNRVLDRLVRLARRQEAIHRLPLMELDLKMAHRAKQVAEENMVTTRVGWQGTRILLQKEVERAESAYNNLYSESESAWQATGRGGTYTPKGSTKANLEQYASAHNAAEDKLVAHDREVEQGEATHNKSMLAYIENVREVEAKIADAKRRIAGEDE